MWNMRKGTLDDEVVRAEAGEARESRQAGLEPPSNHLVSEASIPYSRCRMHRSIGGSGVEPYFRSALHARASVYSTVPAVCARYNL